MALLGRFVIRIMLAIILLVSIYLPLRSEIIILKSGDVFEGEIVKENEDNIELKTEYGVLVVPKNNIKQMAQDVKGLLSSAEKLLEEAEACYELLLELRDDPEAHNKERLKAQSLLYEARQIYDEVRQMFPQDRYDWIDQKKKEIIQLMKKFRSARVRVDQEEKPPIKEPKEPVEEPKEKEKTGLLETKTYAEALCAAIPAMLEGRYNDALLAAETKLPEDQLAILKEHLTSNKEMLEALKAGTSGYIGKKIPLPVIAGLYFNNPFQGLKDGQFALESEGRVMSLPVALFRPDGVLDVLQKTTQDHLARGWFCMQNLWFSQARKEFEAERSLGGSQADFFIQLLDEYGGELAKTSLPVLEKGSRAFLSNKTKTIMAFVCQQSLEVLLQDAGAPELVNQTSEITKLLIDRITKKTSSSLSEGKSMRNLSSAYGTAMVKFAYDCLLEGKDNVALLAVQKALDIDKSSDFAFILMRRILR